MSSIGHTFISDGIITTFVAPTTSVSTFVIIFTNIRCLKQTKFRIMQIRLLLFISIWRISKLICRNSRTSYLRFLNLSSVRNNYWTIIIVGIHLYLFIVFRTILMVYNWKKTIWVWIRWGSFVLYLAHRVVELV